MHHTQEPTSITASHQNEIIRVGAQTEPTALAGAIAKRIRLAGSARLRSIGAAALNQAVKGITIANSYLIEEGTTIVYSSTFEDLLVAGEVRTAINFVVFVQSK